MTFWLVLWDVGASVSLVLGIEARAGYAATPVFYTILSG
jgi:hypothetical protein